MSRIPIRRAIQRNVVLQIRAGVWLALCYRRLTLRIAKNARLRRLH